MFNSRQIKAGTILNDKYEIESILGEGGFGITYLAKDINMNEKVAIKEYFPSALGTRDTTAGEATNEITVIKGEDKEAFEKGLRGFEDEASNLARFNKEAGIVSVKSFFKENNTGYMVMEYIDGVTLKDYLKEKGGRIPCLEAISMMKPVMDSLSLIHGKSIIHRDISPDNIMVTKNGTLKLIDFGAARYVGANDEKSLTVMLKAGFAPPEQYRTHGKQGAWTDIYALSATMYQMISGVVPEESIERIMGNDNVIALNKLCPDVPENISKAIEKGMSVQAEDRYQSIEELQAGFSTEKQITTNKKSINKKYIYALAGIVAVVIVEVFVFARSAEKSEIKKETKLFEETVAEDTVTTSDVTENNSDEAAEEMAKETNDEIVEEEAEEKYLYTSAKVNIRSAPNEEKDNIIAVSEVGQEFEVLSRDVEGWITVKYEDDEAYMSDKYLISKLDYDTWKKYQDKIFEQTGYCEYGVRGTYVNETRNNSSGEFGVFTNYLKYENTALQGRYDDFDGDGTKELFMQVFRCNNGKHETWFANEKEAVVVDDIANDGLPDEIAYVWKMCSSFVVDEYLNMNVGRNKVFGAESIWGMDGSDWHFYTVLQGEPVCLNIKGMTQELGWTTTYDMSGYNLAYLEVVTTAGETVYLLYCEQKYWPVIILGGKFGEYASCKIEIDDFLKETNSQNIIEQGASILSKIGTIEGVQDDVASIRVNEIEVDSIYYNELGFYSINYLMDADWISYIDIQYHDSVSKRVATSRPAKNVYDYETVEVMMDKLYAHVIVKISDDGLEIVESGLGIQGESSGDYEVLYKSQYNR